MNLLVPCRKSLEGTVKVPSSQGIFTPEAGGSTLTRYIVLLFAYLRSVLLPSKELDLPSWNRRRLPPHHLMGMRDR